MAQRALKDALHSNEINHLSQVISAVNPQFNESAFKQYALNTLDQRELKARAEHIADALDHSLGEHFPKNAEVLQQVAATWHQHSTPDSEFAAWPLLSYIEKYGLQHPEIALQTLQQLTALFSAEFAIRPYIKNHWALCEGYFKEWVEHPSEHIRRLVSEGTRPRLPWGAQLNQQREDPRLATPYLEALKDDSSLYVRRSVANHLNDISKDHPEHMLDLCEEWLTEPTPHREWLVKHACRGLIKQGHPRALALQGCRSTDFSIEECSLNTTEIALGDTLQIQLSIHNNSNETQRLITDFSIDFMKANGQHKAKIFKLKTTDIAANSTIQLQKNYTFKTLSTRKLYPGIHHLRILCNGEEKAQCSFTLTT